jgi:hypothetical protein
MRSSCCRSTNKPDRAASAHRRRPDPGDAKIAVRTYSRPGFQGSLPQAARVMRLSFTTVSAGLVAALAVTIGIARPAHAQAQFDARYTLTMSGIPLGKLTWRTQLGPSDYATSANGGISGFLSLLVKGEGSVTVKGTMKDGRPQPASFVSAAIREDEKINVRFAFEGSRVRDLKVEEPPPESDRVPIDPAHKIGVIDPLSAFLIPGASDDPMARAGCERTLSMFDGRRRYDLTLSFKRTDVIKSENGKPNMVLVCAIRFTPMSGHRSSSPLIKFLSEGRDIEVWLVPVTGTRILAPVRLSVASLLGTMVLQANQFETTALTASGK